MFFAGTDARPGSLTWKAVERKGKLVLEASNAGQKRVKLLKLAVTDEKNHDLVKNGGLRPTCSAARRRRGSCRAQPQARRSPSKQKAIRVRSMRPRSLAGAASAAGKAALILACVVWCVGDAALALPNVAGAGDDAGSHLPALISAKEDLFLAVFLNDYDTQKLAPSTASPMAA